MKDAQEIANGLGCLPLALAHAAAYLKHNPATSPKAYLSRIERHLREAPRNAEYPNAVFATFQEALTRAEERTPGAAAIMCLAAFLAHDSDWVPLGMFEEDRAVYPSELVPTLAGGKVGASLQDAVMTLEDALSSLADLSLINLRLETRTLSRGQQNLHFSQHRLVRAACRDLCAKTHEGWSAAADAAFMAAFNSWSAQMMDGYPT